MIAARVSAALGFFTLSGALALARGASFRDSAKCPEMIVIPAGDFVMGSPPTEVGHTIDEVPQHRVKIARPFLLAKDDVTFAEWEACVAGGGCRGFRPMDYGWGRGTRPVIGVNFDDATAYAAWISRRTGRAYRLPTEAEWEYAARAGSAAPYSFGDHLGTSQANFNGTRTVPVGSFAPNAFGLDDMNGNAAQWVADCMHADYTSAPTDGRAWLGDLCGERIVRGGSWASESALVRSAMRFGVGEASRSWWVGFRVASSDTRVRPPPPQESTWPGGPSSQFPAIARRVSD